MELEKSLNTTSEENPEDADQREIRKLFEAIPPLNDLFDVHYKVGEGTFSTVFLATLKGGPPDKRYAVKNLIPTCHPDRIERELMCLKDIGGKDHVVGLELCLRHMGFVVFVMPFMRHDKFSDYVQDMNVDETRHYMRALLTAIRRVHQYKIIHRDVKPSNFLYDRKNKRYLLVDFGLAQKYVPEVSESVPKVEPQSGKRKHADENIDKCNSYASKSNVNKCYCFGKPKICNLCITRPSLNAPRAGTPGYRAPEVLLKYSQQTQAIDMWACGVMMLCILSGTQPFFKAPDDVTALAEVTTLFGTSAIQQCAKKLGKKILISANVPGVDLETLCQKLKNRRKRADRDNKYDTKGNITQYPSEAYELLSKLLDVDFKTRVTADEALKHRFFS